GKARMRVERQGLGHESGDQVRLPALGQCDGIGKPLADAFSGFQEYDKVLGCHFIVSRPFPCRSIAGAAGAALTWIKVGSRHTGSTGSFATAAGRPVRIAQRSNSARRPWAMWEMLIASHDLGRVQA